MLEQHPAETRVRIADADRVHELFDVMIHGKTVSFGGATGSPELRLAFMVKAGGNNFRTVPAACKRARDKVQMARGEQDPDAAGCRFNPQAECLRYDRSDKNRAFCAIGEKQLAIMVENARLIR